VGLPHIDEFGVPAPSASEITLVGVEHTTAPDAASVVLSRPSGTQPGDLLLAEVYTDQNAATTLPTGWTLVAGSDLTAGTSEISVYAHWAASGDPTQVQFDFSQSGAHVVGIKAYRGVNSAQTLAAAVAEGFQVPTVTSPADHSMVSVFAGMDADFSGVGIALSPSDWLDGSDYHTASGGTLGPFTAGASADGAYIDWVGRSDPTDGAAVAIPLAASAYSAAALPEYGWLGSQERSTERPGGAISMGARVYVPQLGRFLQPDPVPGGSANPYDYAWQDPVNAFDLNGDFSCGLCKTIMKGAVVAGKAIGGFVYDHAAGLSTFAGYGAVAMYGVCALTAGTGCALGAALSYASVGLAAINAGKTCAKQGGNLACAQAIANAAITAGGMHAADSLAKYGFKALPGRGPFFARTFFGVRGAKVQVIVGLASNQATAAIYPISVDISDFWKNKK
jgi:RHS repeat-associated protein